MWDICRCDDDDKHLKLLLSEGWEPFAITVEERSERNYDDYTNREYTDTSRVNVVWLRKYSKAEGK